MVVDLTDEFQREPSVDELIACLKFHMEKSPDASQFLVSRTMVKAFVSYFDDINKATDWFQTGARLK